MVSAHSPTSTCISQNFRPRMAYAWVERAFPEHPLSVPACHVDGGEGTWRFGAMYRQESRAWNASLPRARRPLRAEENRRGREDVPAADRVGATAATKNVTTGAIPGRARRQLDDACSARKQLPPRQSWALMPGWHITMWGGSKMRTVRRRRRSHRYAQPRLLYKPRRIRAPAATSPAPPRSWIGRSNARRFVRRVSGSGASRAVAAAAGRREGSAFDHESA